MTIAEQVRSDTLTLLLAYRMNQELTATLLMKKIRQCCEILLYRTIDETMITAYRDIIRAIHTTEYAEVTIMLHIAEGNYAKVYMNVQ